MKKHSKVAAFRKRKMIADGIFMSKLVYLIQCVQLKLIFLFLFVGPLKCLISDGKYFFGVLKVLKFDV